ncbi:hypothetical protein MCOR25_000183 [Pyricularia grisea]|uniref:Gfo/Idh/MocA-like oxidoreductase N-terminal domain-containing protein n=1 Tax=Pyricularia grisea TaxID=148305 RepID=A0A6P8BJ79_PYRGI|nr:uncharacterized protein PgNI_02330 [Pyricularia grisea]KAI6383264.1 hypothetical protein MCOR25_000183 [Pyricularia grisea]TLD16961.1 hypothetical protein PgNI_02330 [Pyricularia grisea]
MAAGHIKVALVGLSATAKTSWAQEAHLPYLLSPLGRSRYELVALCNSTAASAEAARARHGLPDTVRTYGDPADLAADRGVDLVVCCTGDDDNDDQDVVDQDHDGGSSRAKTAAPALRAGKAVYVEWPVAESLAAAVQMAAEYAGDGASSAGSVGGGSVSSFTGSDCSSPSFPGAASNNSIVGLQGRLSPVVRKVKDMLDSGRVGGVLSSEVRAFGTLQPREHAAPRRMSRWRGEGRTVGGAGGGCDVVGSSLAHTLDYVHEVLGEFEAGTMRCRMQVQRPAFAARVGGDEEGEKGSGGVVPDVPDLVVVHGQLAGFHNAAPDATLSVTYRTGPPFKGQPGLAWTINCERGEIMITSPSGPYLHSDSYAADGELEQVTIRVHDFLNDQIINVHWDWEDWQLSLPVRARNVAHLYERFGRWWEKTRRREDAVLKSNIGYSTVVGVGGTGNGQALRVAEDDDWPRIQDGIVRLRQLDAMFRQYDSQRLA